MRHLYSLGYFGPPVSETEVNGGARFNTSEQDKTRVLWQDLEPRTERLVKDHYAELICLSEKLLEHNELTTDQVL